MDSDLKGLRINRSSGDGIAEGPAPSRFSARWIVGGIVVLILLAAAAVVAKRMGAAPRSIRYSPLPRKPPPVSPSC